MRFGGLRRHRGGDWRILYDRAIVFGIFEYREED